MISLTKVSVFSRKTIRYVVIVSVSVILARITFLSGVNLYERFFPDPPPPPNLKFGKLPKLLFEERYSNEGLTYSLQTINLKLPTFSDQAIVYFMPKPQSRIRALDSAKAKAQQLGFNPNGRELVETVYLFTKVGRVNALNINIVTNVFSISYDLNSDTRIFNSIPPAPSNAIGTVKGFLGNAGLIKDLTGKAKTQLLRIEFGELVEAASLSEANLIKVNLYRKEYGEKQKTLRSVTQDPNESNVWFLLSGSGGVNILAGEYHYFPIDESKFATYPVKSTQQAWEDLNNGKALIASLGDSEEKSIAIRAVSMAYYDTGQYVEYYQPVIVFEGDNDFVAYVPAIADEHYGDE